MTAKEMLEKYMGSKMLKKLDLDSTTHVSFETKTLIRLMEEFAKIKCIEKCKEQRELCANNLNNELPLYKENIEDVLNAPQPDIEESEVDND